MSYYGLTFSSGSEVASRPVPMLRVDPGDTRPPRRALEVLREGGVIVYPTDTVYGVGCRIDVAAAVQRLFVLKARPPTWALPVLLADPAQLDEYGVALSRAARRLAARYWPGALTIVVRRSERIPALVAGGGDTVGLRVPAHAVPRALVREVGVPIIGTSANRHGTPAPLTAQHVMFEFGDRVDLVIDGGRCPLGRESTVVDATVDPPRIVREGALVLDEIAA